MQLALSSILSGSYIKAIFIKCLKQQSPLYTNNFMASSVYLLSHCTLSVPPFRAPSTVNAARTARPNLILRHASTNSLRMSSSGRPVGRLLTPVACAVDGAPTPPPPPPPTPSPTPLPLPPPTPTPPRNNKGDGSIVTWVVMALAGALGALGSSYIGNQKTSITLMKGSSRHKNFDQPAAKVNELLMELMDGEKGKKVPRKLKEMFDRNPDETYFVGMGLIKILASRGNFSDGVTIGALLENCYGKSNSPLLKKGDLFLYMVLMHGMVGEVEKAELSWNKFKSLTEESTAIPPLPPSS